MIKDSADLENIKIIARECENALRQNTPQDSEEWQTLFKVLMMRGEAITEITVKISRTPEEFSELKFWTTALVNLAKNLSRDWQTLFPADVEKAVQARENFAARLESVARLCRRICDEMDFAFLYDDEKKVLTIGYRPTEGVRDNSFYDLLASEARLASFIAVASGAVESICWRAKGIPAYSTRASKPSAGSKPCQTKGSTGGSRRIQRRCRTCVIVPVCDCHAKSVAI